MGVLERYCSTGRGNFLVSNCHLNIRWKLQTKVTVLKHSWKIQARFFWYNHVKFWFYFPNSQCSAWTDKLHLYILHHSGKYICPLFVEIKEDFLGLWHKPTKARKCSVRTDVVFLPLSSLCFFPTKSTQQ